jgi:hypothetical protein
VAAPCSQWIACSPVRKRIVPGRSTRSLERTRMTTEEIPAEGAKAVGAKYREYGAFAGFLLGLVVAAALGGSQFGLWSIATTALVFLGCSVGGGILGYLAIAMFTGSVAGGGGTDISDAGHDSHGTADGYGSGDDSHG